MVNTKTHDQLSHDAKRKDAKMQEKHAKKSLPATVAHVNPSKAKSGAAKPLSHKVEYRRDHPPGRTSGKPPAAAVPK